MPLSTNLPVTTDRPTSPFLHSETERLLSRLCVNVELFSVDEVIPGFAPQLPAVDQVIVLYVVKGEGSLEWSDGKIALGKGMIAIIPSTLRTILRGRGGREAANYATDQPPVASHGGSAEAGESLIVASSFVTASAGHGLGYFESLKRPLIEDSSDALLAPIFGGILTEMETRGIGSKCIVESLMKQVLIVMLRRTLQHQKIATPLYLTVANPSLALVINTIQDSHGERLSIPELARMVGMTSCGLTREFKRIFGESVLDYVLGVRLQHATTLLTQTDLPIKSIAASVGFTSRSHFSRTFTKCRGEDPTAYRKANSAGAMELDPEGEAGQYRTAPTTIISRRHARVG